MRQNFVLELIKHVTHNFADTLKYPSDLCKDGILKLFSQLMANLTVFETFNYGKLIEKKCFATFQKSSFHFERAKNKAHQNAESFRMSCSLPTF